MNTNKIAIIGIVVALMMVAAIRHRQTLRIIKEFFSAAAHPINLAVFRIVLFFVLIIGLDVPRIVWFSQLPAELLVPPTGLNWLLEYLPINETWAWTACMLFLVFCFTAMIGLFTRTSAVLAVIFGFYALGIMQFYGKINHYHHLLWFAALLAASRCGDVFSVDAIIAAWKRADRGVTEIPGPSRIYALPLRFVWLLMGIIYFFPGLAKVWTSGYGWAFSENLKFFMYRKWFEWPGWLPIIRVDEYPFMYQSAAVTTLVFELSFIFLIFLPRLRVVLAIGGAAFHSMIKVFMHINFWTLQMCYVSFFDWNAIFRRIGGWLFKQEMYLIYDGNCKLCRRTIASLKVFDIFGRITYVNALDEESLHAHRLSRLDAAAIMRDMHVIAGQRKSTGFAAYRALAFRIPVCWPVLPLLYVWPVPRVANRIYRRVADSRTCSIFDAPSTKTAGKKYKYNQQARAVVAVGSCLLVINTFCALGKVDSWPFTVYPRFSGLIKPQKQRITIAVQSPTEETREINLKKARLQGFQKSPSRLVGMIDHLLLIEDETERRVALQALWQLLVRNDPNLRQVETVQFYKDTFSTLPERAGEPPLKRELFYELKL